MMIEQQIFGKNGTHSLNLFTPDEIAWLESRVFRRETKRADSLRLLSLAKSTVESAIEKGEDFGRRTSDGDWTSDAGLRTIASQPSEVLSPKSKKQIKANSAKRKSPMKSALMPSGGFRKMFSFGYTCLVYHATTTFCKRFFPWKEDPLGKTTGQMVGAARSARQNIVEASARAGTSKETELKLLDVAKGSLAELQGDYEAFLTDAWSREAAARPQTGVSAAA